MPWFAIKTSKDFAAETMLTPLCESVFFPMEKRPDSEGKMHLRPAIPHVLFIRTSHQNALQLELRGRDIDDRMIPFWIYRLEKGGDIQPIPDHQMAILRLLTAVDNTKCEIYHKTDFEKGMRVRVTGGIFAGQIGHVQRVRKNKHVIVKIEGVCAVLLPFIHPDLLQPL
ncbi:MAG: hypothetical protein K2J82_02865 [Muribaculaceae bacterium]|nr:hypothetical protein [Muribaculaceae bacterium]MDE6753534.1 hypothetical protein [Muribaculaceae bacterium]